MRLVCFARFARVSVATTEDGLDWRAAAELC
jgi:hypothetical protein